MNYTLKELTSMPFEDWAALIEMETWLNEDVNLYESQNTFDNLQRQIYSGTIGLSSSFSHPVCIFSAI